MTRVLCNHHKPGSAPGSGSKDSIELGLMRSLTYPPTTYTLTPSSLRNRQTATPPHRQTGVFKFLWEYAGGPFDTGRWRYSMHTLVNLCVNLWRVDL